MLTPSLTAASPAPVLAAEPAALPPLDEGACLVTGPARPADGAPPRSCVSTWQVRCPHPGCESYSIEAISGEVRLYDETLPITHRCKRCGSPFRVIPPVQQSMQHVS